MIDVEQIDDQLYVSYYNEDGNIKIDKIRIPDHERFVWESDFSIKNPQFVDTNGVPVKKKKQGWLNNYRILEILNNLEPKETRDAIFKPNQPKKFFMDIETEVIDGFPDYKNPKEAILSNSFCDQNYNVVIMVAYNLSTTEKEKITNKINNHFKSLGKTYNVKFRCYDSEVQMMSDLFYDLIKRMPLLTGWNFLKFDWNYMVNRCKFLGVGTKLLSCTGNMYKVLMKDKWGGEPTAVELPYHRGIVDYQEIWTKWDTSVKLKAAANLDYVGKEVLGIEKIHFPGTFMDLWKRSKVDFLFYNAVDTILVSEIDRKLQTFNTMLMLASEGRVPLISAQFASVILESLFSSEYYKRGVVFTKKTKPDKEKYKGGFVHEPAKGFFKNVIIEDFESMFPSIVMMLNTGIDTYLGKVVKDGELYLNKEGKTCPINPATDIWSSSGVVYDKSNGDSVMRAVTGRLFDERIHAKKASAEIYKEIKMLEQLKTQLRS